MDPHFAILQAVLIPLTVSIILPWIYGQSKKEGTKTALSREQNILKDSRNARLSV